MFHRLPTLLITTTFAASIGVALAQPGNGNIDGFGKLKVRMFGKEHPFKVKDLRRGRLRNRIESLPLQACNTPAIYRL